MASWIGFWASAPWATNQSWQILMETARQTALSTGPPTGFGLLATDAQGRCRKLSHWVASPVTFRWLATSAGIGEQAWGSTEMGFGSSLTTATEWWTESSASARPATAH